VGKASVGARHVVPRKAAARPNNKLVRAPCGTFSRWDFFFRSSFSLLSRRMLRPFGKQQHILPEQQGMRKERGANFPIPFFLFWVLFLAEGDASIKPHPGHIYCVQIADRLAVRVAGFDQAEAGRVQVVPKIGECDQANVVQQMPRRLVEGPRIAVIEAAAEESDARAQRNDVRRGNDQ